MRILMIINYNETQTKETLKPFIQSKEVNRIYMVHDWGTYKLPKVYSYRTPEWLRKSGVARTVVRILLMMYLAVKEKPDAIIGFSIFAAVHSFICGKMIGKPVIVYVDDHPIFWRLLRSIVPILKLCDVIGVTGTKNRKHLIKLGIPERKVVILPVSIDVTRFKHTQLPKRYDIISVGRLVSAKRIDTLLKIIAHVKEFKKDLRVGIVGDGPLRGSLENLACQLDISDNVEFLGFKKNTELYYNSSKTYVLTSYREGLPRALLEAMACGLPSVVSRVGDIPDVAINGVNSIVIDNPNDTHIFATAIIRLLSDNELAERLSKSTETIKNKYSHESVQQLWDKLLLSISKKI